MNGFRSGVARLSAALLCVAAAQAALQPDAIAAAGTQAVDAALTGALAGSTPSDSALAAALAQTAPEADARILGLATHALACARSAGVAADARTLSVIDYSRPSTQHRLWVFDLQNRKLLFDEWVAHGRNSGDDRATHFSNGPGSLMSSLGAFVTENTYSGHNGYSLRLHGLDPGFNDNADARAIVVHGARYVSANLISSHGRLGRSWGCPAVRPEIAHQLIDAIRGGSFVFAYYPDRDWLAHSPFLGDCSGARTTTVARAHEPRAGAGTPVVRRTLGSR